MAYLSKETIDLIKSKNDIVDVMREYGVNVDEKGKADCPFHSEKTRGGFSVHKEKQIFKCFSCGVSGNVITFIQKKTGCSFLEAIQKLADRASIKINIVKEKQVDPKVQSYHDINNFANSYYKNMLLSSDGKKAMEYLKERNISKSMIDDFDIGLSINNNAISKSLNKKYDDISLLDSGLVKEYNNELKDAFINRIMFPIIDENKNVIGFSGRKYLPNDLANDEISKYINTKDTIGFEKSKVFYNINNAKDNIIKKREIIICEGQMDTIRVYSIGYKNVVASLGTALTKEHLNRIKKYKCSVVLNFDQDEAGIEATISTGEELIKNNIDTHVIVYSQAKDSDELITKYGKEFFDKAYNNKVSFIDFKLNYLKSKSNMKDSLDKAKYINDAIKSINELNDDILRELKIKELATEFDINESIIRSKITNTNKKVVQKKEIERTKYNKYDKSELRVLYLMLNYEDVITIFENRLGGLIDEERSLLAFKIMEFRNDYGYFNYNDFIDYIEGDENIMRVLEEVNKTYQNEEYTLEELDDYIKTIKKYNVKKRIDSLKKEMEETLDVNKKIEIGKKIEDFRKEVLEW